MIDWRVLPALASVASLAGPFTAPAAAQQEPVYAVYDGFMVTDEGLHVLAFAYFSHNFETVTIPVGPLNSFGTAPGDRQQTTTFLPGPEFDGGLRWTLDHAGVTTTTSDDMLQYNWEFEASSVRNALRDVEPSEAPHGVCLNRSPTVRFLGLRNGPEGAPAEVATTVGAELKLFGSVRDEGLPRAGALVTTWRMLTGPGTVTFSAPDEPRTLASFDAPGAYELELWASDGEREGSNRVAVIVDPAP